VRPLPDGSKVVLLNLPGRRMYIRDYYCSKTSKTNYLFSPCDLLMLSGGLAAKYDISVIDCIAERLNPADSLTRLRSLRPHAIVFLAGAVSWEEDAIFLENLKDRLPKTLLIGTGDIFLEGGKDFLAQHAFIDAALLDFSSDDLIKYFDGATPENMVLRQNGEVFSLPLRRADYEEFSLPIPRQELFMKRTYRLPFLGRPFATVLTDFGCPFKCSFCIMGTLGYRYRNVNNVIEELSLIKSLGISNVFFMDQTFRPRRSDNLELTGEMLRQRLNLKWICYSRVDVVDEEILGSMKKAGCHTIMFGVESSNPQILRRYRKGYTLDRIQETFAMCKKLGLRTVGTFIMGLPEDTEQSCRETIEVACALDCDYASFNFAVPRAGTELRSRAVALGLVKPGITTMDQSGSSIAMPTLSLTREDMKRLRRLAIKKYYLRPEYLWKCFQRAASPRELREMLYAGISLFRNLWLQ